MIEKHKRKWLIVVLMAITVVWAVFGIYKKSVINKINNTLLAGKSYSIKVYFPNTKIACVTAPYFTNTQNIKEIRDNLSLKQVLKLNHKIHAFVEDDHWDLILLDNKGYGYANYQVYHVPLKSAPNFKDYQCVSVDKDSMEIYPAYHDKLVYFELR